MDSKLRNLKRLSATDPASKERYIRELERLVGLGEESEEGRLKCLVKNCPNRANQGGGYYAIMQSNANHIGEPVYNWDKALGPFFLCSPCYHRLLKSKDHQTRPDHILAGMAGSTMVQGYHSHSSLF